MRFRISHLLFITTVVSVLLATVTFEFRHVIESDET